MKLKWKLLLPMVLVGVFPLLILGFVFSQKIESNIVSNVGLSFHANSKSINDQIDKTLFERVQNLFAWSKLGIMDDILTDDSDLNISNFLKSAKESYLTYKAIHVTNKKLEIIASSDPKKIGKKLIGYKGLNDAIGEKRPVLSKVQYFPLEEIYSISISIEIINSDLGEVTGTLIAILDLQKIDLIIDSTLVNTLEQDNRSFILLTDAENNLLSSSKTFRVEEMLYKPLKNNSLGVFLDLIPYKNSLEKDSHGIATKLNGKDYIFGTSSSKGYDTLGSTGMNVLILQEKELALMVLTDILSILNYIEIALIIFTCIFGYFFANAIIKPINELVESSKIIAEGKFDLEVVKNRKDELGELQESSEKMRLSLKDLVDNLEQKISARTEDLQRVIKESEQTNLQLQNLSQKLSKYLAPQVYDSIFSGKNDVKLESNRKNITVFFSDIKGFTAITDRMESEALTSLLNNYLQEMSEIALRHGGTIDKFIGDAIMVFFGAPESRGVNDDAVACVSMALEMRERMESLRGKWVNLGISEPLRIRMGINSGYCTVGNFGSDSRLDYTIIGGQVNLASRLESHSEADQILISNETYALIQDKIKCEKKELISVKGIAHPIQTYHVIELLESPSIKRNEFKEESEGFKLKIDMNQVDKERAISALKKAIAEFDS
ncbi:MAG: hypothetical protein COA79_15660 [Planctomycetota bacterium]|nr:MAG: hypothetical protein COA79_15660 [Planctomycetota bacterium]